MHAQAHTHAFTHAHAQQVCMHAHTCKHTHTHTREREHGMYMYIATYTCPYIHTHVCFFPAWQWEDFPNYNGQGHEQILLMFFCSWQDQCVWSNWKRKLSWWWYFVIGKTILWKIAIALLCWRPGSQQRFKISLNVFPGDIFWIIQPFVAKHGLVFHHHGPECLVKRLFCYHQGQSSAHRIKLWLFQLYLQSCWLFCN